MGDDTKLRLVSQIRTTPSLKDIAAQLRQLADAVESSEVEFTEAYVLLYERDYMKPRFYAYGEIPDRHGIAGRFFQAAQLTITDKEF